ncbi:MAG: 5'-methylthioadenosine/adenosylhomocysteine nucleosidase [Clostridia bacterium]|nr:5'-methylthioadenosine/adenosylhomocysteine nucleosidase [Clostridia bacterium]
MKKYGIIAAMQEEMQEIKNIMKEIEEQNIFELAFVKGKINDSEVILVEAGVGKVNAARVTQILIDNFEIEAIINVGSAGAANDGLEIGDIVIGEKLVQHDFDITAFGHPKGHISNVGQFVESDNLLIQKMEQTILSMQNNDFKIKIGTIASGDIFCTELSMKQKIRNKFSADAIEMEGAAIAQVCKLDNMPFIVIRSISDKPNGNNNITFNEFLEKASKRCAKIIKEFLN